MESISLILENSLITVFEWNYVDYFSLESFEKVLASKH